MVIAGHPSGWNAVSASALGSSHRAKDAPNQDAVATFEIDHGLCVALADGHGGSRYVRSAEGARIAVDVARKVGTETLRRPDSLDASAAQLPARLVAGWRAEVASHLTAHPLDAETVRLVGPDPFVAYGATLLLLMFRGDQAVAMQLGDGDVVVAWADGSSAQPVPTDDRNVAGQTTSLCLADAVSSFRIASLIVNGRVPEIVVSATDGYGNSFVDPGWPGRVTADLLQLHSRLGTTAIAEALPRWAAESAEVGGDDTTVAVVFRNAPAAVATAAAGAVPAAAARLTVPPPAVASTAESPRTQTAAQRPTPARGRGVVVAVAGAALFALGVGGGMALDRGDTAQSATSSSPVQSGPVITEATPEITLAPASSVAGSVPPTTEVPPSTADTVQPPASTAAPVPTASPQTVEMVAAGFRVQTSVTGDSCVIPSFAPVDAGLPAITSLATAAGWWFVDEVNELHFWTWNDGPDGTADLSGNVSGLAVADGRVLVAHRTDSGMTIELFHADGGATDQQCSVAIPTTQATADTAGTT